jgi:hypothetical protein
MIASFLRRLDNARTATDPHLLTAAEVAAHELNHRVRRSLGGKTPCKVHHNPALRLLLDRRSREGILRLLVEAWLRCQGLIIVGNNQQPDKNVSPIFPKKWSHN